MSSVNVYNGYADLRLSFDGKWFLFPQSKVTKLDEVVCTAPDEYKREHPSDPDPQAILEHTYKAREFAEMLFTRHNQNLIADRCVLVSESNFTEEQKKAADSFGRIRKMKQVEEALAARRQALAAGGKCELDADIVTWLIEYDIFDDLYNRKPERDQGAVMAEAFAKALASLNQSKPELTGAGKK